MVHTPVNAGVHISSKKLYVYSRGVCGVGWFAGIFFFSLMVSIFSNLFIFLKIDLYRDVMA